jgi:hypothetical protein
MTTINSPQLAPTNTDCTAIAALIPEYAFGLLTESERALVESQLAGCPEAAQQLADFEQIQASMRASVPSIDPPADLEARLMAALGSGGLGSAAPAVVARVAIARSSTIPAPADPRPQPARPIRRNRAWLAVAAALIVLVLSNLYWAARVSSLTAAQVPPGGFAVAETTALRWARLPPAQQGGPGAAFMMWNARSQTGIICVWGLPKLETGQMYRLWVTRGDWTTPAGSISVDEQGRGALIFALDAPIDSYSSAYITAEMDSGSPAPVGPPVLTGKLPV